MTINISIHTEYVIIICNYILKKLRSFFLKLGQDSDQEE
jgi:hypothetical protein